MTDDRLNALMSPQPTVIVESLANNPDYIKCPRCWHYTHEGLENYDGLCDRCCATLISAHKDHESVPRILKSREKQRNKYENLGSKTK